MRPVSTCASSEAMRGARCGLGATIPMSVAMLALQRLLPKRSQEAQEPQQIVDSLLHRVDGNAGPLKRHHRLAAVAAHFGYGAATGAFYPVVEHALGKLPGRGPAYGLALFIASYCGWLPALNILPPPKDRRRGRNLLLIASHVVWGNALQRLYSTRQSRRTAP